MNFFCIYWLFYGVFPLPDSDSYTDSYSDSYEIMKPRPIPMPIPIPMATVPILAPI